MMTRRNLALALATLLVLPLLGGGAARAMEDMGKAVAAAQTKADHEKLAADFEAQAKAAEAKAADHQAMAEAYKKIDPTLMKGLSGGSQAMVRHCEALAKSYKEQAEQYAALAKAERALAAAAK